jgi:HPt (histidine-containing phosphotransfer) domain-containing protein
MIKHNKYLLNTVKAPAADLGAAGAGAVDYADLKPALDVADGLSRLMNNKKLYCRLLRGFPGSQMAADIAAAVGDGDHSKVRQAAHTLKGVSANLALSELAGISQQIEMRAKAEETAGDLLPILEQAVTAATAAIARLLASEEA